MDYTGALKYIENIDFLGSKLGLGRIEELLKRLGNPQDKLRIIHVAGTNGKGSVSSMIMETLISAGYKTALYTSPHLERYNERYIINNEEISNEDFAKYTGIVKEYADIMAKEEYGCPTVFEQLTAMAFLYFFEKNVDYAVIEVGLGGRFDATNVVKKPILSVITSISMDHTEFLGNTIESIAFEKGGIIKDGCPVVLYRQSKAVFGVIDKICKEKNARLYYAEDEIIEIEEQNINRTVMSVKNHFYEMNDVVLHLLGEYQINNCATAILAAYALRENGVQLEIKNVLDGIKNTRWNGRMEICRKNPYVIIDGAHNADGIYMLAESIKRYFSDKRIVLLMGVLGDKEYVKMASEIAPLADAAVITEPDSGRALSVKGFEAVVKNYCENVYSFKRIEDAYDFALSITGADDALLCAGSLYLIGRLRTLIMGGI